MNVKMLDKNLLNDILAGAKKLSKDQIKWRRHLHKYPEISNQEFETTAFLKERLKEYNIKTQKIDLPTGIIAEINRNKKGKTVAVRTDIDALPIFEMTGLSFKSVNKGCMHACGHDVHMAVVLGTACLLKDLSEHLNGNVRFIFQPAEEMPPGGARPMIEAGCLKDVSMIFGLHTDPNLPVGKISTRDGVTMASVTDFDLIVKGVTGHAARPQDAVDAIVVASEIVSSLQTILSRELDPIDAAAVTFGKIEGGTARNVIAGEVRLTGTARTLSKENSVKVPKLVKRIAENICKAHSAKLEMNIIANYPVLSNSPIANRIIEENYRSLFNKKDVPTTPQVLGGEDFACYLEKVDGAMFRLGIMNKKIKADKSWHSPEFMVDEDAILFGTATLAASVISYLKS